MASSRKPRHSTTWPAKISSKPTKNRSKVSIFAFLFQNKALPKVSRSHLLAWSRQLAHLLQNGVALSRALEFIQKTRQIHTVKQFSQHMRYQVMQGTSLSQALHSYPGIRTAWVQLVAAGEQTGTLATQIERWSAQLERELALSRQFMSALSYPMVVLVVAFGVLVALLWWVVPTLAQLFQDMGAPLPAATQAVLATSQWVQRTGPWVALGLGIVGWGFMLAHRRLSRVQFVCDYVALALPLWGRLRQLHQQSQWAYSVSTLLMAQIPLVDALESTALASPPALAQNTHRARLEIIRGNNLSQALGESQIFDHLLVEMARIGEESGHLGPLLFKTAQVLEADLNVWVNRLTTLIEPTMVLMLGALIGGVVLSMYLPIFQMGQLF